MPDTQPPYIPFAVFKTFVEAAHEQGLQPTIRSEQLPVRSKTTRDQFLSALRFLRLLGPANSPSEGLVTLANSFSSPAWRHVLEMVLRAAYPPLFEIPLSTLSREAFESAFSKHYRGTSGVIRKSRRFFLYAAIDAGIRLSDSLARAMRPRKRGQSPSRTGHNSLPAPKARSSGVGRSHRRAADPSHETEVLLELLDTRRMSAPEQEAVWTLIKYVKRNS